MLRQHFSSRRADAIRVPSFHAAGRRQALSSVPARTIKADSRLRNNCPRANFFTSFSTQRSTGEQTTISRPCSWPSLSLASQASAMFRAADSGQGSLYERALVFEAAPHGYGLPPFAGYSRHEISLCVQKFRAGRRSAYWKNRE